MATARRAVGDPPNSQVLFVGRILAGCCLLAAVLLVWTQQYYEHEKHKYPNSGTVTSSYEGGHENPTFSCKIDQLDLELPQAPDLIIGGAAKSGTTTIAHWLLDHPAVLPTKKWEAHFFTTAIHPREFEPLLKNNSDHAKKQEIICELKKRYLRQWPDLSHGSTHDRVYTFDKTPDYLFPSRVPALIRALFQTAAQRPKILLLLRNPIDRAYSHYRMGQRMMREEHVPFEEFIQRELELLHELGLMDFSWDENNPTTSIRRKSELSLDQMDKLYDQVSDQLKGHNYLSRGLYAMQLERWFRHGLGPDMLFIPYQDLTSRPQQVYSKVLEFVGMPNHDLSKMLLSKRFNYNDVVTEPLVNSTRLRLAAFYKEANQDLVNLLEKHNKSLDYDWQKLWA